MTMQIRPTRTVLALALAIAAAASAPSALAAVATASAAGKIIAPIAISKTTDLAFGNFANGVGTVVLGTGGTRSATGTVTLAGGTATVATFAITGEAGLGFSIDYTGTSTTLVNGASTIAFTAASDLTGGGATSGAATTGVLTAGAQTLYVGGTLTLVGGELAGDYTGTVSATVQYN